MNGKVLRERRKALHLTQEEFALKAGISLSTLGKIEKGLCYPREDTVKAIRNALVGLSPGKPYGHRLREARKTKLWTVERLAAKSGVCAATIYKIELGETNPRVPTHQKLIAVLGEI